MMLTNLPPWVCQAQALGLGGLGAGQYILKEKEKLKQECVTAEYTLI